MTKEQKAIISISSCICLLDVFYELFFNIYIMQTVTSNIILIFACYMAGIAVCILLYYPFFKILNGKTAIWIYRFSFVLSFIIIILSMTIHSSFAFTLIFITALRYVFNMCYYIPQEVATMKHVKKDSSDGFLAFKSMTNTIVKVFFSLTVSALFAYFDTIWLFGIMLVDVAIMFVLSFGMKSTGTDFVFRPKEFIKETKQYPHMKYIYFCQALKRLSEAGLIQMLLPIMLFMNLGSEFSLGIYSSIACVITACWLPVFVKFKNQKNAILLTSMLILIVSSVLLVFLPHPATYVAYYLINQFASASFTNAENASLFDSIKYPLLCENKEEHAFVYGLASKTAEVISFAIGILFYWLLPPSYSIPAIMIFFMIIKLASFILLTKSDKLAMEIADKSVSQI